MTFEELGLNPDLQKAIKDLGFNEPTPIQEQTIALLLEKDTDIVALAQTGTGKTAAFGLPMLEKISQDVRKVQALVLSPTRELCVQISNDFQKYTKYLGGIKVVSVYGGVSIDNQIRDIKKGAHIIVATPGRLVDMIDRRAIDLTEVEIVVLDEADEMLNMGFKDDLDAILKTTPTGKNTWLFSATMPAEVLRIAKNYMSNPVEVSVGKRNQGADNIEHNYFVVNSRDRYLALKRVVDYYPDIFGIVFCRTKRETQEVADHLIKDGYNADALHGDLSQAQRDLVMKRYRSRTLQMLVATDVAARGIDVDNVTHVINYNLPEDAENYTHRSGRTARAGKSGIAIAIVTGKEIGRIREIEKIIGKKFEKKEIPNGVDVCEKQLFHLVNKLHKVEVNEKEIESYLPAIYDELKELSKEELIKRIVSEEFNRFLNYYRNAPDLNEKDGKASSQGRTTRFFINLGSFDGLQWMALKDFLADETKVNGNMIFNVEVKNSFSFFESETRFKEDFLKMNSMDLEFNGRKIAVEVSEGGAGGRGSRSGGGRERSSGGERKSYGGGERKSYGGGGSGRSYGGGERKSYGGGEKRSYGGGEKKSYGSSSGEKSYGAKREGSYSSERRSSGSGSSSSDRARRPRK